MLAASGLAFAAFCIWFTVRVVNRREKSRRMIWLAALAAAALLSYPLSFGPTCRLAYEGLIPESQFMTVYRPCIRLALDGPQAVRGPLQWWDEQWGGHLLIVIVRDLMSSQSYSPSSFEEAEDVVRQVYHVLKEDTGAKSLDDDSATGEIER